ncbi:hypothetical protein C2G38_2153294 [Gigaspora rosea]|uniref:Uncharacterized protein n=1 Tax=Gigaspora rosea TaxID=44941 RepID=A0A397W802_9GLOM|nr:hypothetical protein C2G38_2153294 [Gigaspora rosea]
MLIKKTNKVPKTQEETTTNSYRDPRRDNHELAQRPKKRQPRTRTETQEETTMNSHRDPRRDNHELAQRPKKRQPQTRTETQEEDQEEKPQTRTETQEETTTNSHRDPRKLTGRTKRNLCQETLKHTRSNVEIGDKTPPRTDERKQLHEDYLKDFLELRRDFGIRERSNITSKLGMKYNMFHTDLMKVLNYYIDQNEFEEQWNWLTEFLAAFELALDICEEAEHISAYKELVYSIPLTFSNPIENQAAGCLTQYA